MKIRPKIGPDCYAAVNAASGERLNKEAIDAAFQRLFDYRESLKASGNIDGMADKLKKFAEREAERTKVAAAMQKRHAALNILVRDRQTQAVEGMIKAGLRPSEAIRAILEGTQDGVENARVSVAAMTGSYERRYLGGLMAELQANRPHVMHMFKDQKFDADVMREMVELREGGKPGLTGNADAKFVAKLFASYYEMSRTDLNRLGASIGKMDGYAGAQGHDDVRMIKAGKDQWVGDILPHLDMARTFPDVTSAKEIDEIIRGIYDTITSGMPAKPTPGQKGQRVNPANLAKSLGKSRVLHFKDADSALAYRDKYGYGNTVSSVFGQMRSAARMAANMEMLGPNPDIMFTSLVENLARRINKDPNLSAAEKQKQTKGLNAEAGILRSSFDVAAGLASRPVHVTAATIGADIRAAQSMAKLGGAIFSSLGGDPLTAALASQFRGSGFFKGLIAQFDGILQGRTTGEKAEIGFLTGEGFDGFLSQIVAPAAAVDGPVGKMARLQETFFKWNGLTWFTDKMRSAAGRMIAAEMGMRAKTAYVDLPANYRHVLGLHGITEAHWNAIRKIETRTVEGKDYVTPDMARNLADDALLPLVADRLKLDDVSMKTRQIERRMKNEKEAEWVAKRKEKLDEWQVAADARLSSTVSGNEIRTEIDKQIAQRRIEIEKAQIEQVRTELEVLSAARESDSAEKVRLLLLDARETRKGIDGLGDKGGQIIERLSDKDFRGGHELGKRYQAARNRIRDLNKQIADMERSTGKKVAGAIARVDETFKTRLAELNEFVDKSYTREQARIDADAKDVADQPRRRADIIEGGRRDLELALGRFVADETSYGVVEVDNSTRRMMYRGNRPGTVSGELLRFIWQFKAFPAAFTNRVIGRALYGHRKGAGAVERGAHIGALLAGMTMAGYVSLVMKDLAKGYWPPRDPTDGGKTLLAAFVQGGGAGIYGDYLFAQASRFGNSPLETAAGAAIGTGSDIVELGLAVRNVAVGNVTGEEADFPAARALTLLTNNTPFANLAYVRPALDYLFLNSMREAASPGYLRKQEKRRRTDYDQSKAPFLPNSLRPFN